VTLPLGMETLENCTVRRKSETSLLTRGSFTITMRLRYELATRFCRKEHVYFSAMSQDVVANQSVPLAWACLGARV
jgi:hypothetical protein